MHSSEIARQTCLPWRCSSFVPLQRPFRGKRCNSRIAWFGAVGRSTSLTTPFSSCPLGLLIWATSIALHLRSWLAPLYVWSAFRASLTRDLETSHSLPGLWITAGSKILEISGRTLHCLEDIPRVSGTSKPTWVRIADPNNPYTSLSKSSQQCLTWLASCFRHSPIQPLARPRQLQALARVLKMKWWDWGLGNHILPSGVVRHT